MRQTIMGIDLSMEIKKVYLEGKLLLLVISHPTLGEYAICTEMYGNGVKICLMKIIIVTARIEIHAVL